MSESPIRVLLAEDHRIVREGLRALLSGREDIELVGEVGDGEAALEWARATRPDVVVMDLNMPGAGGIDTTRAIRDELPDTRVLVLSMHGDESYVRPALRAGASGYLLKGSGLSDLVAAIRAVARDEAFLSPAVAKIVLQDARRPAAHAPPPEKKPGDDLTPREREILALVGEGHSSPEIARALSLSVKTVEGHRSRIMAKLEVRNVAGLVKQAIRLGLISAD